MTIKVKQYDPPVEKTYISSEVFEAVDQESNIGLRVIDGTAQLISYDSTCAEYTPKSFSIIHQQHGFKLEVLENLLEAYKNRGK